MYFFNSKKKKKIFRSSQTKHTPLLTKYQIPFLGKVSV